VSTQKNITFNVSVQDNCPLSLITKSTKDNSTVYNISYPSMTIQVQSFNLSNNYCGSLNYSTLVNNTTPDPLFISFDNTTLDYVIQTSDVSKMGNVTIKLIASLDYPYNKVSATLTFTVRV
jgi:hypothetical protein